MSSLITDEMHRKFDAGEALNQKELADYIKHLEGFEVKDAHLPMLRELATARARIQELELENKGMTINCKVTFSSGNQCLTCGAKSGRPRSPPQRKAKHERSDST